MAKEWYVLHTYSGHENKVKTTLEKQIINSGFQDSIFQVKIPTSEVVEIKDGKKKVSNRKSFPGYVLIEMELNDDTWSFVKSIPSVTNFVGAFGDKKPKPLTREEIASLFDRDGNQGAAEKTPYVVDFVNGEHVKVTEGPFSDFEGVVEEVLPEKGRLRVKVEIFGRGTPVELDFSQVGKI